MGPVRKERDVGETPFDVAKANQWFAVELNNKTWDLLESADRSEEDSAQMIHTAHAACYHWREVGKPANYQRAECLLGNVYAALGQGQPALTHASRALDLCEKHPDEMADWDHAFVFDCLARATAAGGLLEDAANLKQRARDARDKIADPQDKDAFNSWFNAGQWHGIP